MPQNQIDYVTVIEPVLEVTLLGVADPKLWREELSKQGLPTTHLDQQANLILSLVDAKFKGIRFQEFSISVEVAENQYFLAHAYNSIALFAYAERKFFRTPYYNGTIALDSNRVTLAHNKEVLFDAQLPENTPCENSDYEQECLQIHLPKNLRKSEAQPHYFHAKLEGITNIYAPDHATVNISTSVGHQYIAMLAESDFQLTQWKVRPVAKHSKSKTYFGEL